MTPRKRRSIDATVCVCPCACCRTSRCQEQAIVVKFPPRAHVTSGSLYQQRHGHTSRLCDFIAHLVAVAPNQTRIVLAELKSRGAMNASHVRDQLQGGATLITSLAPDEIPAPEFLVVHNGISGMEVAALKRERINWKGRKIQIRPVRSGFEV